MKIDDARWAVFKESVIEREAVYVRKEVMHAPRPWTRNSAYQQYRFCNVHRCLDKTYRLLNAFPFRPASNAYWAFRLMLRWSSSNRLIEHLLSEPNTADRDVLIGAVWVDDWKPALERYVRHIVYDLYAKEGIPLVTGSFIVKRPGGLEGDVSMFMQYYAILRNMKLAEYKGTIAALGAWMQGSLPWCGSFTAYCLMSDMMYFGPLNHAPDLFTFCEKGPGAQRGAAFLCREEKETLTNQEWQYVTKMILDRWQKESEDWYTELKMRVGADNAVYVYPLMTAPMMLDVEHWLCEYYKYVRGYAKKRYV